MESKSHAQIAFYYLISSTKKKKKNVDEQLLDIEFLTSNMENKTDGKRSKSEYFI